MLSSDYAAGILHEVVDEPVLSFLERWGFPIAAEMKEDGERVLVEKRRGRVTLANRRKTVYTEADLPFGLVSGLKAGIKLDGIYDGEFATTRVHERALYDFLSGRAREDPSNPLRVILFDVLEIDGKPTLNLPLSRRRKILDEVVRTSARVQLSKQFLCKTWPELSRVFESAVRQGYEGIVVKEDVAYETPNSWQKWKMTYDWDVVVLGAAKTDDWVLRERAHAVLIGAWDGAKFVKLGKVGTGLSSDEQDRLAKIIREMKTAEDSEFVYCEPRVVLAISAMRVLRDKDGSITLREPRILRIRFDKNPKDCLLAQFGDSHSTQTE